MYLQGQRPTILGYFASMIVCFGARWLVSMGSLGFSGSFKGVAQTADLKPRNVAP